MFVVVCCCFVFCFVSLERNSSQTPNVYRLGCSVAKMAAGKLPQSALNLKQVKQPIKIGIVCHIIVNPSIVMFLSLQFFLRRQVLSLYREILRTLREVPNEEHKKELADWARAEFKKNKHEKDEVEYIQWERIPYNSILNYACSYFHTSLMHKQQS